MVTAHETSSILTHPTMAEGPNVLFAAIPAAARGATGGRSHASEFE
jgi:hypothetical protein